MRGLITSNQVDIKTQYLDIHKVRASLLNEYI